MIFLSRLFIFEVPELTVVLDMVMFLFASDKYTTAGEFSTCNCYLTVLPEVE